MYKHPISAFVRLIPALSWVAACAVTLWMPVKLVFYLSTEGQWKNPWSTTLMLIGFVAVAVYAVRMAYQEYREVLPQLRADMPVRLGFPKRPKVPLAPLRYPLTDALRAELQQAIQSLQRGEMLLPGDVTIDEVIDYAELTDEWLEVDLHMVMNVLHVLSSERERPFTNIAFFPANTETDESSAVTIVQEFARLCLRSHELSEITVRSINGGNIVPAREQFSPPNAVAKFRLGTERYTVPFVFYSKDLPGGLIESLAKIFISPGDPHRFVWENFDNFFAVSWLTPSQSSLVNSAERKEFPRFVEVA